MALKAWLQSLSGRTLVLDLTPAADSGDVDLSDVDSAEVHIQLQQGGEAVITAVTLANQSATTLRLLATFDDPAEVTKAGRHTLTCKLTMGATPLVPEWTKPRVFDVKQKYEVDGG